MMLARDEGQAIDAAEVEARVEAAVREVVQRQRDTGIDVLNDGEMSKPSYSTYVKDRLSGFEGKGRRPTGGTQEAVDFPGFARATDPSQSRLQFPVCTGPVALADATAVERDIARVQAAAGPRASDIFMTSVSPGQIARFMPNAFYPSHEAYIWALADAMQAEYEAIVAAGMILQVDCPDLASGRTNSEFARLPLDEWLAIARIHVEALNHALRRIPAESVRLHLCWGTTLVRTSATYHWRTLSTSRSRRAWEACHSRRRIRGTRTNGWCFAIGSCPTGGCWSRA
jgi:5-methyltetrahydropteroyltriglutamate--homocysteine methyltransferase